MIHLFIQRPIQLQQVSGLENCKRCRNLWQIQSSKMCFTSRILGWNIGPLSDMPLNTMSATLTRIWRTSKEQQATISFIFFCCMDVPVPSLPLSLVIGDGRVWRYSQRLYAPAVLSNDVTAHWLNHTHSHIWWKNIHSVTHGHTWCFCTVR